MIVVKRERKDKEKWFFFLKKKIISYSARLKVANQKQNTCFR
jgi:hypothetical protein